MESPRTGLVRWHRACAHRPAGRALDQAAVKPRQNRGSRAGSTTHILPADYALQIDGAAQGFPLHRIPGSEGGRCTMGLVSWAQLISVLALHGLRRVS